MNAKHTIGKRLNRLVAATVGIILLLACAHHQKPEISSREITGLYEFPVGLWEAQLTASSSSLREGVSSLRSKVRLHIHRVGAMWGEVLASGGAVCTGEFQNDTAYAIDLGNFSSCLNTSGWRYELVSRSAIRVNTEDGQGLTFRKLTPPKLPPTDAMKGVWEALEGPEDQSYAMQISDDYGVQLVGEWSRPMRLYQDEGGVLLLVNHAQGEGEVEYQPVRSISAHRVELCAESEECIRFSKAAKLPDSQLILDDYGRAVELNDVNVSVNILGSVAETIVDIVFTNRNPEAEEVQFTLPIPRDATVSGYALDIDGAMIPGVAIPREDADEAFEILENRGIDPGLAKVSETNQFSTQIYPVPYGKQRRVRVIYVEPLTLVKAKDVMAHYQFPVEKFGEMQKFALHVEMQATREPEIKSPKTAKAPRERGLKIDWNGDRYFADVSYDKVRFDSPLEIDIPIPSLVSTLFKNVKGEFQYAILGVADTATLRRDYRSIQIAWDTSLSMKDYHAAYVRLLASLVKRHPQAIIQLMPFNIRADSTIEIAPYAAKAALEKTINQIRYDGGSNMGLLKRLLKGPADLKIVFTDGIHTNAERYELEGLSEVYVVHPDEAPTNTPLLEGIASQAGVFSLNAHNVTDILDDMAINIETIHIEPSVRGSIVRQPSLPDANFSIVGKLDREELPLDLSVRAGNSVYHVYLAEENAKRSQLGEFLLAKEQLAPLLVAPRNHKQEILSLGLRYGLSTPFTTLIVLEDLRDYAEFGIAPPREMDSSNNYAELRRKQLLDEQDQSRLRTERLVQAWENRIHWWRTGEVKSRWNYGWAPNVVATCEEGAEDCNSVLEEVVVMGIRASSGANVHLEPWNPDVPYMKAIRAAPRVQWRDIYEREREGYIKSMPFYMDMAKFFFDQGLAEDGTRILSNVLEIFPEKTRMERLVAYILLENNLDSFALPILEHLNEIAPYQASSKRDLALLYEKIGIAEANKDQLFKALNLYYEAATQSNDDPFELPVTALMEMNNLVRKAGHFDIDTSWIDKRLLGEIGLDLRITLSWTNEFSMVDLYVTEPSGEIVEWKDRISKIGAWLPYDSWANGPVEYLLKDAVTGEYQTRAVYWSDDGVEGFSPIGVRVDFYLNYGRPEEQHVSAVVRLERVDEEYLVGKVTIPEMPAPEEPKAKTTAGSGILQ